ncbi:aldehyde dehydrogenase family protein [Novosphingobium flavum]|uniref:Aldehyde dehydrogenase family protein n=1 Tax=Novosphingobium flavum TaxID=1778672 RepID=A0A7X1FTI5_9SPHN|nr:aldehyde dehydrogenase family protein [Novosphingobium flavum]MBC2666683.1 aldehyde dehydrogenase family protein [Novosphingobium flavum]
MSDVLDELFQIDALGPSGAYRSRNRMTVTEVGGKPVAELSLAPAPYVSRAMSALRKADTMDREARLAAIARAGEAFQNGTIAGLSPDEYHRMVSRISGLGIAEVRSAAGKIAAYSQQAWDRAQFARPLGVVPTTDHPSVGKGVGLWVRRGDVFGVHAAGNHPAIHGGWLEALALGYRVAVRPSRREPLTPHRLVTALHEAGFGHDHVIFLPTDYAAADEMIHASDLAMVYGGADVIAKYSGTRLLPQGPGRSKILIAGEHDWRDYVDLVVESASRGGGTGCTNVTTILVEGDRSVAADFARAVADKLALIPSLRPEDECAVLPVQPIEEARRIESYLLETAQGTEAMLGGEGIVDDLGDGSAVMRPAVHVLDSAADVQTKGIELAFPCLWFAPWSPEDGLAPLKSTLNLVLIGAEDGLIEAGLEDGSIRNVYAGAVRSYFSAPNMPHDGYLADFLMKSKGYVRVPDALPPAP